MSERSLDVVGELQPTKLASASRTKRLSRLLAQIEDAGTGNAPEQASPTRVRELHRVWSVLVAHPRKRFTAEPAAFVAPLMASRTQGSSSHQQKEKTRRSSRPSPAIDISLENW